MEKGYIQKLSEKVDVSSFATCNGGQNINSFYLPIYSITYGNKDRFSSTNLQGSWWSVDFINRRVKIYKYRIKTGDFGAGADASHPKSWYFYGKTADGTYKEIDRQFNQTELNGPEKNKFYNVNSQEVFIGFKIILIESFGSNVPYVLTFSEFDVYERKRHSACYVRKQIFQLFFI